MPLLVGGGGGGLGLPRFSTKLEGRSGVAGRFQPPLPVGTTSWPPAGDTACALAAAVMIPHIVSARPRLFILIVVRSLQYAELPPFQQIQQRQIPRLDAHRGPVKQRPGESGRRRRGQGEHPIAVAPPPA